METTKHGNIIRDGSEGNGYHGRCEFCGLALVTDLGYSSWSGTKCTPREIDEVVEVKTKETPSLGLSVNDFIDKRVTTECGDGYICGHDIETRFMVKIIEERGKKILKSLFPDNILCFWLDEITLK